MRRPWGVFSVITCLDRLARSGLSCTAWWIASAAWLNSPSWEELELDASVELALAPPSLWPAARPLVAALGEGGDCFCITDWAPPAWALSSPITLPPNTPPEPDTVWAMDWGAK